VTHLTDDDATGGGEEPARSGRSEAVRRLRALSDTALVDAMHGGDELALGEFVDRFRPLLEHFARRTGIPQWEWGTCITEVLDDVALKVATGRIKLPTSLGGYLVRAVRYRHVELRRSTARRDRHYLSASDVDAAERVVVSLCSENTLRASQGPARSDAVGSAALARLAMILRAELSEDEVLLLAWRSAGVPHRQVAAWLGITYAAAAKRIARLSQRLRAIAWLRADSFPAEERVEIARFFRRVGIAPADDITRPGAR
jgi:DNA-directed RNA polymerase specialized sigma24 family protein